MALARNLVSILAGQSSRTAGRGWRLVPTAAACLALLSILPHAAAWLQSRHSPPTWTWDLDAVLLRGGLLKSPRFRDTLSWWTGTWVGQVPFYRPLTSYLFWIEWKVFGDQDWLYVLPDFAAHIAATILFAALVFRLARIRGIPWPACAAIIAAWGFSGWLLEYRGSVTSAVFLKWKNQPDSFAAVCCFASLLCYLRAQEQDRGMPLAAALWYLAGCGFKEIAVPLPVVCAMLDFQMSWPKIENRKSKIQSTAGRRLGWMFAAAGLFLGVRYMALRGIGYTYGSNVDWLLRTVEELFGPFGATLARGEWLGNAVGTWVFCVGVYGLRRMHSSERSLEGREAAPRRSKMLVTGGAAIVIMASALGALYMFLQGDIERAAILSPLGGVVGFLRCLQPVTEGEIVATLTLLIALAVLRRQHAGVIATAYLWTLAFLIPLMLSPSPIHRYYISQAGYYLLYACAAGAAFQRLFSSGRVGRAVIFMRKALASMNRKPLAARPKGNIEDPS